MRGADGKICDWRENSFVEYMIFLLQEQPRLLEEQRNKTESCYYLFEIGTSVVCPKQSFITVGLSVGSVLLIM